MITSTISNAIRTFSGTTSYAYVKFRNGRIRGASLDIYVSANCI